MVEIYCDGGCRGNGKETSVGGYGIVVVQNGEPHKITGGKKNTTNNEMELTGLYGSIKIAKELIARGEDCVKIYCDSAYSLNTTTDWMWKWAANGWTKKGGEIKNLELIQSIYNELNFYCDANKIELIKVKGHAGNEYNELADKILNEYMDLHY